GADPRSSRGPGFLDWNLPGALHGHDRPAGEEDRAADGGDPACHRHTRPFTSRTCGREQRGTGARGQPLRNGVLEMSSDLTMGLYLLRPELLLTFYGFFLLLLAVIPVFRRWVGWLAALGCVLTLMVVLSFPYQQGMDIFRQADIFFFSNLMILDTMAIFF